MKKLLQLLAGLGCYGGSIAIYAQPNAITAKWSSTMRGIGSGAVSAPANWAFTPGAEIAVLQVRPFFADGVQENWVVVAVPVDLPGNNKSGAGGSLSLLRLPGFQAVTGHIGWGLELSRQLAMGIALGYRHDKFPGGMRQQFWSARLDARYMAKAAVFGLCSVWGRASLFRASPLQQVSAGIGKDLSAVLYAESEVQWQPSEAFSLRCGLLYTIKRQLRLGMCWQTLPFRFGWETAWSLPRFEVAVNGSCQPAIGWTPGIRLLFFSPRKTSSDE
ncbi:hypothetical protein [Flavihumibacter petaseus]|uniref:Transporter n=1 Tax=Flavihumibacter petaseus NBRC 106054 TaxID=1220578 RepID=A0A0E9N725_9BACT|nr:hypothetical protein [Flavihumibacter petaseus]GAO45603.1 hypothetical protein FPE01S_06_00940 [Flavihumibacter petaseus NBRC 106054]